MSCLQKILLFLFIFSLPIQKRIDLFSLTKNYFNEWGTAYLYLNDIFFLMLLISLLVPCLFKKFYQTKPQTSPDSLSANNVSLPHFSALLNLQLFLIFFLLANFDHYFWSLHNGALLFWLILAFSAYLWKKPNFYQLKSVNQYIHSQKKFKPIKNKYIILKKLANFFKIIFVYLKQTIIVYNKQTNNNTPSSSLHRLQLKKISLFIKKRLCKYNLFLTTLSAMSLWLVLLIVINPNHSLRNYQIYFTLRLILYFIFFLVIIYLLKKSAKIIIYSFLFSSLLQSIIALAQFVQQKSLGLKFLAESPLSLESIGIAKINAGDVMLIRAYGLLPHPNLLSAYLLVSFVLLFYLLNKNYKKKKGGFSFSLIEQKNKNAQIFRKDYKGVRPSFKSEYILIFIFLVNLSAFFLTFSRIAYLVFILMLASFILFFKRLSLILKKTLFILIVFSLLITLFNFRTISQRFSLAEIDTSSVPAQATNLLESFLTSTENKNKKNYSSPASLILNHISQSPGIGYCLLISQEKNVCFIQTSKKSISQIKFRLQGIELAFNIIRSHPLIGIGQGLFVLQSRNYSNALLELWQLQPVHNLFILQAAEIGLVGFVIFNLLILQILKPWKNFKLLSIKKKDKK